MCKPYTRLGNIISRQRLGFGLRVTILGHVQRGATLGPFDRLLATRLGAAATEHLAQGEYAGRIALVENYDQQLAAYMVRGVDVWLNNLMPPLEASGTSGMRAAVSGTLSLSILDRLNAFDLTSQPSKSNIASFP